MISPERKDGIKVPISQELLQRGDSKPISLNKQINVFSLMPNILAHKFRVTPALERDIFFSSDLTPRTFTHTAAMHGQAASEAFKRGDIIDAHDEYKKAMFSTFGIAIANRREGGKEILESWEIDRIPLEAWLGPLENKLIETDALMNGDSFDLQAHLEWLKKIYEELERFRRKGKTDPNEDHIYTY